MKQNFKALLCIAATPLFVACAQETGSQQIDRLGPEQNIINGTLVEGRNSEAARSLVMIEHILPSGLRMFQCSATLIGSHTILSAAHCFNEKIIGPSLGFNIIFTNNYRKSDGAPVRHGFAIKQHPNYIKASKKNIHIVGDIAVASFEGDIPDGYNAVALDSNENADYSGLKVYAYGYGRSMDYTGKKGENLGFSSNVLHRGVISIDDQYKSLEENFWTTTDPSEPKLCQGDSGGPIFYHQDGVLKQIGVNSASWGPRLANGVQSCKGKSLATKVSHFYSWVIETQKALNNQINNQE